MTYDSAIDKIGNILEGAGFQRLPMPLNIASLSFDFPAAFVGTGVYSDLVIVADTIESDDKKLQKQIEGIARALDVLGSQRSITVVLSGPRPRLSTIDALSRVCRALPVGTMIDPNSDQSLKNWLSILLPLEEVDISTQIADPLSKLMEKASANEENVFIAELIHAANGGDDAVQFILGSFLSSALELPLQKE